MNKKTKNKSKNNFNPKIFFIIFLGLSFLIAFIIGGFYLGKNQTNEKTETQTSAEKTYTDPTYKFIIIYPSTGQVINKQGEIATGKCGTAIKQTPISSYNYTLAVDNYFIVTEQDFSGSIQEFINSYPGGNLFTTKAIDVPGADEAVTIKTIPTATPDELMSSAFTYTTRIIKKGDHIFQIVFTQNAGNVGGCIAQGKEQNKIIDSFRFAN